jgi:hypothetical protein
VVYAPSNPLPPPNGTWWHASVAEATYRWLLRNVVANSQAILQARFAPPATSPGADANRTTTADRRGVTCAFAPGHACLRELQTQVVVATRRGRQYV